MKIGNYHLKDIYFNENERKKAEKFEKRMIKNGWTSNGEDNMGDSETYTQCIQMIK